MAQTRKSTVVQTKTCSYNIYIDAARQQNWIIHTSEGAPCYAAPLRSPAIQKNKGNEKLMTKPDHEELKRVIT